MQITQMDADFKKFYMQHTALQKMKNGTQISQIFRIQNLRSSAKSAYYFLDFA